jgi:hypothetical protein
VFRKFSVLAIILIAELIVNTAVAEERSYVFGSVATTRSDIALGGLNGVDDDKGSYSVGFGILLADNLGVEAAWVDYGTLAGQTNCPPEIACVTIPLFSDAELKGVSLSLLGSLPLSATWKAYARLGFLSWDVDYEGLSAAYDASDEDLLYGIGLRWSLSERWKSFVEYQRVNLDLKTASVGVSYHF